MELDPKALWQQMSDVALGAAKSTDSERAVGFVKSLISSMEKTVKAIDKYLSKAKDGLIKGYDIAKEKGEKGFKAGVTKLKDLKASVKEKGLKGTLTAEAATLKGKMTGIFSSDTEKANGPPDTLMGKVGKAVNGIKDGSVFESLIESVKGLNKSVVGLTKTNEASIEVAKSDSPDSKKPNRFMEMFKKQRERMSFRKKEIDEEKAGIGKKEKGQSKGPLGLIISAISALGGIFTGGIGKLLKWLPGLMLRGVGGLITSLIPSISGAIASTVAGGVGTAVKGAAMFAGRAALGLAVKGVGVAAGAIFSPIGLGIIAGAAVLYGGYKLYKYLNRNNLGDGVAGKLTRLRMLSYGYNDVNRDHYNKILDLDMLVKGYVSPKEGRAVYKKFDEGFKTKVMEIFGIGREDKEKYELLNQWFVKRYVPSHAAFMHAYYGAGGKDYLDDIEKLNGDQMFKMVTEYRLPVSVHDHKTIPVFENSASTVTKDEIDTLINAIRQEAKKESETGKGKSIEEEKAIADARLKTEMASKKAAADKLTDASKPKPEQNKLGKELANGPTNAGTNIPDPSDRKFLKAREPLTGTEEGEKPPPTSAEKPASEEKPLQGAVDKVSKAPGPLTKGGPELIGIKSRVATEKIHNLDPNVLNLLSGMTKEYKELTGKDITVNEAFRSRQDQEALKRSKGAAAAAPGTSLHEYGIAVDINSNDADVLDKMGLMRKYGFTRPMGGETWHVEPAGVSLNPNGSKKDPVERTNNILASPGRGGGGLGAKRGLPSSLKYKRDIPLQKTLFNAGESIESPVKVADLKGEENVAKEPILDNKQVKDTGAEGSTKTESLVPPNLIQGSKRSLDGGGSGMGRQEGLDAPRPSAKLEGPQISKALYRPSNDKSQTYSDYSEGEKPPSTGTRDITESLANLGPREAILKASQLVGVNHDKLLAFAKMESSLRSGVKAGTSSATGLFQIVGDTWNMLLKKYGPKYNIPADAQPSNAYYNSVLGACYAKENMGTMSKYENSGIRQDVLIYLAHHFGPTGGTSIVKAYMANPESPIQMAVSEKAYRANIQELGNKTVRQYIDYLTNKLNKAGSTGDITPAGKEQSAGAEKSALSKQPLPAKQMASKAISTPMQDVGDTPYQATISKKPPIEPTEKKRAFYENNGNPSLADQEKYRLEMSRQLGTTSKPMPSDYSAGEPQRKLYTDRSGANEDVMYSGSTGPLPTRELTNKRPVREAIVYDETGASIYPPLDGPIPEQVEPPVPQRGTVVVNNTPRFTEQSRSGLYRNNPPLPLFGNINKGINDVNANVNSKINGAVGGITNQINKPINAVNSAINNTARQVNGVVGGINGVFSNISKGINDTSSILSKGMNPAAMGNIARQVIPQQPSSAMSLDKTESLLTGMGDTLSQIKGILQAIHDKSSMTPAQAQPSQADAAQPAQQSSAPVSAPNYNIPSTKGVSMSRKSVLN